MHVFFILVIGLITLFALYWYLNFSSFCTDTLFWQSKHIEFFPFVQLVCCNFFLGTYSFVLYFCIFNRAQEDIRIISLPHCPFYCRGNSTQWWPVTTDFLVLGNTRAGWGLGQTTSSHPTNQPSWLCWNVIHCLQISASFQVKSRLLWLQTLPTNLMINQTNKTPHV